MRSTVCAAELVCRVPNNGLFQRRDGELDGFRSRFHQDHVGVFPQRGLQRIGKAAGVRRVALVDHAAADFKRTRSSTVEASPVVDVVQQRRQVVVLPIPWVWSPAPGLRPLADPDHIGQAQLLQAGDAAWPEAGGSNLFLVHVDPKAAALEPIGAVQLPVLLQLLRWLLLSRQRLRLQLSSAAGSCWLQGTTEAAIGGKPAERCRSLPFSTNCSISVSICSSMACWPLSLQCAREQAQGHRAIT